MAENIIQCPQCQRQLRVPEEMLGKLVKCPTCNMTFTVAAAEGTAPPPVVQASQQPAYPAPESQLSPRAVHEQFAQDLGPSHDQDAAYTAAARLVRPPAICLLITGAVGLVLNLFGLASNLLRGDAAKEQTREIMTRMGMAPDPQMLEMSWTLGLIFSALLIGTGVVVVVGSMRMLQLRSFALAVTASILAMVNIGTCCCAVGIPIGIWSLVILLRQDVRAAFE